MARSLPVSHVEKGADKDDSLVLGSIIGSGVGFYRGIRETAELTGSVRTSS